MDTKHTEIDVIRAAQHGDLESFNLIVLRYQDFLFRMAMRIMGDEDMACDVVQEACILVFRKISMFREGSFRSWLARIISNVCYDELRRRGRYRTQPLEAREHEDETTAASYWLADPSSNPEMQYEAREVSRTIERCLATISPPYQMVLILIDMEDFSYEEAAAALKVPIGTIKSRLARARLQMKAALQDSEEYPVMRQYDVCVAC